MVYRLSEGHIRMKSILVALLLIVLLAWAISQIGCMASVEAQGGDNSITRTRDIVVPKTIVVEEEITEYGTSPEPDQK